MPTNEQPATDVFVVEHHDTSTDKASDFDFVSGRVQSALDEVVADLRALAVKVESIRLPQTNQEDPGFGVVANEVVRLVMGALPNMGLGAVVTAASEADRALLRMRLSRVAHEAAVLRANPDLAVVEPETSARP